MNYADFKDFVAGFTQRSKTSYVVGGSDVLALAINQARRQIERRVDFEMSRVLAYLTLPVSGDYVALSTAKLVVDDSSIDLKQVVKAFYPTTNGGLLPIDVISRNVHIQRIRRTFVTSSSNVEELSQATLYEYYGVGMNGLSIYLIPAGAQNHSSATTVRITVDGIRWLADYSDDDDSDFLLEYAPDVLLYQTVKTLNMHLREDQRVPVSDALSKEAWDSLVDWNRSIAMRDDDGNMQ